MFRAQANTFDEVVVKATDENLTSENWALILDVCDRVSASPQGPSSAVAALIKRLSHRNANVQLYTLELANALSQNCGPPLHRELASRSFTDALLRLANDRNTHQQVKSKILERMHEWTEMFRGDADLGIMEQAYDKLRRGNPSLQPPSKPMKREIGDDDRRKEEEELQMALALSIRDKGASPSVSKTQDPSVSDSQPDTQPGAQAGTTAATVSRVKALYDFTPSEPGELAFRKGDIIAVLESVYKDWWKGSLRGQTGIFPLNYVEKLQDPTREELERDAAMEGEVFAQIRNVEKLLALLSVRGEGGVGGARDQASEEEITELYHQTLAIRPKLIELIGKYSQKKDDFTQLNEKFIKARRDYEALLESSMSQAPTGYGARPPQPYYNAYNPPQPQGYPPQQGQQTSYPPPGPAQDHQRYYTPAPSEPPHSTYGYPPAMNGPTPGAPAPFHFLPGGAPSASSENRHHTPKPGTDGASFSPQLHSAPFNNNRPQSIHTLNHGNPQELATAGSTRRWAPPQQPFSPHPPQQQQQQQNLPIRNQQPSFDSPSSVYSPQGPQDGYAAHQPSQPPQPVHAPPSVPNQGAPGSPNPQNPYPVLNNGPPGGYQAYNPGLQQQQQGHDDVADYYR
ncbi:ESCRT-0 subunit protein hse1 [Taxawa tesnikishii (nom. ined.)]|nr:ESCRT-0 subunit protein hse1 [Dothideales sp. JES 119]